MMSMDWTLETPSVSFVENRRVHWPQYPTHYCSFAVGSVGIVPEAIHFEPRANSSYLYNSNEIASIYNFVRVKDSLYSVVGRLC